MIPKVMYSIQKDSFVYYAMIYGVKTELLTLKAEQPSDLFRGHALARDELAHIWQLISRKAA